MIRVNSVGNSKIFKIQFLYAIGLARITCCDCISTENIYQVIWTCIASLVAATRAYRIADIDIVACHDVSWPSKIPSCTHNRTHGMRSWNLFLISVWDSSTSTNGSYGNKIWLDVTRAPWTRLPSQSRSPDEGKIR